MIIKRSYEGHEIVFSVDQTQKEVMVDARGIIKAGRGSNKEIKDEKLRNIVSNFMRKGYHEDYCRFVNDDSGGLVIWMDSDLAIIFAKTFFKALSDWCKTIADEIMNEMYGCDILANKLKMLNHQKYDYNWHPVDIPEGMAQSFNYYNQHIMLCVTESGDVVVNVRQIIDIFKRSCSNWFVEDSTSDLVRACSRRGGISWLELGSDKETCSLWMDISLVEDLAVWYEKGNNLKLWLQNRAEELRFFKETAKNEVLVEAYGNCNYLTYNCKIGRV